MVKRNKWEDHYARRARDEKWPARSVYKLEEIDRRFKLIRRGQHLLDLGYQPTHDIEGEMEIMLKDLMKYKHRIEARAHALIPDIRWDRSRRKVSFIK